MGTKVVEREAHAWKKFKSEGGSNQDPGDGSDRGGGEKKSLLRLRSLRARSGG